ncbi:hypothetical protein MHBO_003114 [Bonamia ostreae]|uniref:Uncharacterized protein n=1 Tax=Bonamia ostreae TaxID=126728 RepID=A0ABV2APH9_9EUKA
MSDKKQNRNGFARHLHLRTYNFAAKTGIKRLSSFQVLARSGGHKVLRSQISLLEGKRLWEDFSITRLKNAKKKASNLAKELSSLRNLDSPRSFTKIVSVLGTNKNKYLVVRKHDKRNRFVKSWESVEKREIEKPLKIYEKIFESIEKENFESYCYFCRKESCFLDQF